MAELRLAARSLEVLDAAADPTGGGREFPVVVARDPSAAELRAAAARVAPGGALVVEVSGPSLLARGSGGGPGSAGVVAERLAGLGFDAIRSHWHWPNFDRCTRIVPLDDRVAVRYALGRSGRGVRARLGAWIGRGLLETGLLRRGIASASVIARRAARGAGGGGADRPASSEGAPAPSVVHAFLARHGVRLGPDRPAGSLHLPFVVLTPRFRNSSHLVFLLLDEGGRQPVLVAKVPRRPDHGEAIEREADRLRAIQACRPAGFDSIPRVVAFEACGGRSILVQTAMPGAGMDRTTVRRNAPRCCDAALAWLLDVQTASRGPRGAKEPGPEALVERDLVTLELLVPAERALFERTRELLRPLGEASLPAVLEHRDLSHPNIIVGPDGRVAVIDWEQAELRGLPAVDLVFFLTYVAMAIRGARSPAQAVAAIDGAFFHARGWARAYLIRYARALGLPGPVLTPLFVVAWVRQVAGVSERVGEGDAETAEWLPRDWRFAALGHAVDHAGRLVWDERPSAARVG